MIPGIGRGFTTMKRTFIISFFLVCSWTLKAQEQTTIFAELYSERLDSVFRTDLYNVIFYDNLPAQENTGKPPIPVDGWFADLFFIGNSTVLKSSDSGIVRFIFWDEKIYGYCSVGSIEQISLGVIKVSLIGRKNVPQRKKLLFKDSASLRMWKYFLEK